MSNELTILTNEFELIAQAMLSSRGNLAHASRNGSVSYNAMALRAVVKDNPIIRQRYHELLGEEMEASGIHIAERILQINDLLCDAYGTDEFPADPKTVIELSKELSRLIAEGKANPLSSHAAVILTSKEGAKELLQKFLDS